MPETKDSVDGRVSLLFSPYKVQRAHHTQALAVSSPLTIPADRHPLPPSLPPLTSCPHLSDLV